DVPPLLSRPRRRVHRRHGARSHRAAGHPRPDPLMRIRDFREDDTPEINLIPLIDVVLCLIIFFVVTTTFESRSVLKLQLPRAQGETVQTETTVLDVLVNADGRYFVGDREALRTDLE